jgi:nitrate reductase beta subunit
MTFLSLPDELILQIFLYCKGKKNLALVCTRFRDVYSDPLLWEGVNLQSISDIADDTTLRILATTSFTSLNPSIVASQLHKINLSDCYKVTDAGILFVLEKCRRIRHISLSGCPKLTGALVI